MPTEPRSGPIWRLAYTLYYHRADQLWRRFRKRFLDRWIANHPLATTAGGQVRPHQAELFRELLARRIAGRRASITQAASAIQQGQLCFLGQTADLGSPLSWNRMHDLDVDHLWRFHLHYHEFLFDLAATNGQVATEHARDDAWSMVASWIDRFPLPDKANASDAWHPFCISRRLPVWMMLWHHSPPPVDLQDSIQHSLHLQAAYLVSHLELDPGGNHLLENLRTLAIAAVFLETGNQSTWLSLVDSLLRHELPTQCLESGEHFERTPAYHAIVLELLLEIRDVMREVRPKLSAFVGQFVESMQRFLATTCHPDGEIPLFSDSSFGSAPAADAILRGTASEHHHLSDSKSDRVGLEASVIGGYWIWRTADDDALIFDRGQAAVDHLPAHAHCDLLNMEASVGGKRLIVDSGVYDYGDTEMRKYCRGTSAHNVLEIDGLNQFDVWSRFRMGYRGHILDTTNGEDSGVHWAQAQHNAYRRVGVPTVGRWIGCHRAGSWICIDWANTARQHRFANRVRIHPDFQVEQTGPNEFVLGSDQQTVWLSWLLKTGSVKIEDGWYCPEFGRRIRIPVITWRHTGSGCYSAWRLNKTESASDGFQVTRNNQLATVAFAALTHSITIDLTF